MAIDLSNMNEETRNEFAALSATLASNPKTRKSFLKLHKEAFPDAPIPEIDTESAIEARLAEDKKQRDEWQKKIDDERFQERMAKQKAEYTDGLSEEQVKQMESMMEKGELPADYKWGAQLFRQQIEPVGGSTYDPGRQFGPFDMPSGEGLMENEQKWSNSTAHQMIDEMRKNSSRSF